MIYSDNKIFNNKLNEKSASNNKDIIDLCIEAIDLLDGYSLYEIIHEQLMILGVEEFIYSCISNLNVKIGNAWAEGRIDVFGEQLYSKVIERILKSETVKLKQQNTHKSPRVLLINAEKEHHIIGLMMVEILLTKYGCDCLLETKGASSEKLSKLVIDGDYDIVAMSFTDVQHRSCVKSTLHEVRSCIPAHTLLWAGGSNKGLYQGKIEGVQVQSDLKKLKPMVDAWRSTYLWRGVAA